MSNDTVWCMMGEGEGAIRHIRSQGQLWLLEELASRLRTETGIKGEVLLWEGVCIPGTGAAWVEAKRQQS